MRILFISHEATQTGAPKSLLNIIGVFKNYLNGLVVTVFLLKGGPLEVEFKKFGKVMVLNQDKALGSLFFRVKKKVNSLHDRIFRRDLNSFILKNDVVFVNSVASIPYLHENGFCLESNPFVLRVAEMPFHIDLYCGKKRFEYFTGKCKMIISASETLKTELVKHYEINPEKIIAVYSIFDSNKVFKPEKRDLRKMLGLYTNSFLVGNLGAICWHKGVDIFLQIALDVKKSNDNVFFIWIGKRGLKDTEEQAEYDIERMGLKGRVFLLDITDSPEEYYPSIDILLLTSRIDSFPLVVVESASFGKPVVCFENSGGAVEFVSKGGGEIVPYLDVKEASDKIIEYVKNPEKIKHDREIALQSYNEFLANNNMAKLVELIKNLK